MSALDLAGAILYDPSFTGASRADLLWRPVVGRPLVAWTVEAFARLAALGAVLLVVPPHVVGACEALVAAERWKGVAINPSAAESLALALPTALAALPPGCRCVVVHDLARPLVAPALVAAGLDAAGRTGAASAVEPVKETIKRVEGGVVVETLDRSRLGLLQTPQVFDRARLTDACARFAAASRPPDAATLARAAGLTVATFPGDAENLAVRTEGDLRLAERLLLARQRPAV